MTSIILNELKAFPTAYGCGAEAIGGRNGIIYIVNTLTYSTGATYHAASGGVEAYYTGGIAGAFTVNATGIALNVVFDVSGNITIPVGTNDGGGYYGRPNINNFSILGQTAPQGGITFTGDGFHFNGGSPAVGNNDIIFRYFRSRPRLNRYGNYDPADDDAYTQGFLFYGANKVIIDHISSSFASDKGVNFYINDNDQEMENITVSYSLFSDNGTNFYFEINGGRPQGPPATQNLPENISALMNVSTHANRTPNMAFGGYGEILNNVTFDATTKFSTVYWNLKLNYKNNYFKGIKNSGFFSWNIISNTGISDEPTSKPEIYANGNYAIKENGTVILDGLNTYDEKLLWTDYLTSAVPADSQFFTATEHVPTIPILYPHIPVTPFEAYTELIVNENVGANVYIDNSGNITHYLDDYDAARVEDILTNDISYTPKVTWTLPTLPSNTRPGGYYVSVPGIPEWFCTQHGITSSTQIKATYDFGTFQVVNNAGYTAIEIFASTVDFPKMLDGTYPEDASWSLIEDDNIFYSLTNNEKKRNKFSKRNKILI